MSDPRVTARRIVAICQRSQIGVSTEGEAHYWLADALRRDGLQAETEVRLTTRDRIDIMVGNVAVEVKVQGSRREIWRQLQRYADLPDIHAIVIATATPWPPGVDSVGRKPLFHASLVTGWL